MEAVRNEMILTTCFDCLSNSFVRLEVRKAKPTTVEGAVRSVVEMQSYLNLHGHQPESIPTASINNLAGSSVTNDDLFTALIFIIKEEVKRAID